MIVSKIVDLMISCFDPGDNFALFLSLPENWFLKEPPFSSQRNPFSQFQWRLNAAAVPSKPKASKPKPELDSGTGTGTVWAKRTSERPIGPGAVQPTNQLFATSILAYWA
ncbi:MAG: hypothetical protein IM502_04175 [Microcystis sp. M045S2]|nr:hypothetical protein [Microcystis sp. M045S2]